MYVYKEAKSLLTYVSPTVIFAIFTAILIRLDPQWEGWMYSKQGGWGVRQDNRTIFQLLLYHALILWVIMIRVWLHDFILNLSVVVFFFFFF